MLLYEYLCIAIYVLISIHIINYGSTELSLENVEHEKKLYFKDFGLNEEYTKALQNNRNIQELHIRNFTSCVFPDLSNCTSLTSLTIESIKEEKCDLSALKNINSLTHLDVSNIELGYKKNALKIISNLPNLNTFMVHGITKYFNHESKGLNREKYKKLKQYALEQIERFNHFPSLQNLTITDNSYKFYKPCFDYYESNNKIPPLLYPYLQRAFVCYQNCIPHQIMCNPADQVRQPAECYPVYDHYKIVKYKSDNQVGPGGRTIKKVIRKIIWKKAENNEDILAIKHIINTSTEQIYLELRENAEEKLAILHNLEINHKNIVGLLIKTKETTNIMSDHLLKYENLFLALLIKYKRKKKFNHQSFNFIGNNFDAIKYINTNDHMIFLENQSKFSSLGEFVYNNVKNNKSDFEYTQIYTLCVTHVVFKSLENQDALRWLKKDDNWIQFFIINKYLEPYTSLFSALFKNFESKKEKKIIEILGKTGIANNELKSLEIFLKYSHNELSPVLKKILEYAKINNETDWQLVQEKYLPIIQKQMKLTSAIISVVKNIVNILSEGISDANSVFSFVWKKINIWKYISFILLFLYLNEKRDWWKKLFSVLIKTESGNSHA